MNLTTTRTQAIAKITASPVPTATEVAATLATVARTTRPGGELRGNSTDRARRTARLLAEFGDGETCLCVYCGIKLAAPSLTQDRIVSGTQGGRYRLANLLPACLRCNQGRELSDKGIIALILTTESREGQMI